MLCSQHPHPHCKHLALHLLRLIALSLAQEGASQIVRGNQRVGMLGSQHPLPHCKHLALHLLRLIALSLALEEWS